MKKYKCPDCGKINTSMYCDTCQKSIPSQCQIDTFDPVNAEIATVESTEELRAIKKLTESSSRSLNEIEHHTRVMAIIMVISLICSAVSVVSTLVMGFKIGDLFLG